MLRTGTKDPAPVCQADSTFSSVPMDFPLSIRLSHPLLRTVLHRVTLRKCHYFAYMLFICSISTEKPWLWLYATEHVGNRCSQPELRRKQEARNTGTNMLVFLCLFYTCLGLIYPFLEWFPRWSLSSQRP